MAAPIPKLIPIRTEPAANERPAERPKADERKQPDMIDDFGKAVTIFSVFPDLLG